MNKNLDGKMNNKGFSLVELIVVIAIMGILAITLTPRLTQYVDKARKAVDKEVVHTMLTATRLGFLDNDVYQDFTKVAAADDSSNPTKYTLTLSNASGYTVDADTLKWTKIGSLNSPFWNQFFGVIGDGFTLKSSAASTSTKIILVYDIAEDTIQISLDYDGDNTTPADYTVTN